MRDKVRFAGAQVPPIISHLVWWEIEEENNLFYNLDLHSGALCSEPCDVVYALLGISSDRDNFTVDYSLDFADVFAGVMSKCSIEQI